MKPGRINQDLTEGLRLLVENCSFVCLYDMRGKYLRLIHWNAVEAEERASTLRRAGYEVICTPFKGPVDLRALRNDPPHAMAIDLTRIPSSGRGCFSQKGDRRRESHFYAPATAVEVFGSPQFNPLYDLTGTFTP